MKDAAGVLAPQKDEADLRAIAVGDDDAVIGDEIGDVANGLDDGGVLVRDSGVLGVGDQRVAADSQENRLHDGIVVDCGGRVFDFAHCAAKSKKGRVRASGVWWRRAEGLKLM